MLKVTFATFLGLTELEIRCNLRLGKHVFTAVHTNLTHIHYEAAQNRHADYEPGLTGG